MKNGFTLLELLLVIACIGILVAISYPLYKKPMAQARRTEAKLALLDLADHMEQYYLEHQSSYLDADLKKFNLPKKTKQGYYTLDIPILTQHEYLLRARANFDDQECPTLTLNQQGRKNLLGSSDKCW
jgi:type IV pilus assembly protein PilE